MEPNRSTRAGSQRKAASNARHLVSASSLGQQVEALRTRADNLSVEDLREIGRQIELALPGSTDLRAVGLGAAALFTTACSTRPDKEQEALLGAQDKVLAGIRAILSLLSPDLHRSVRAVLLPLVAQPGFVKKVW
ncbi:unnamed protein product [Ectocarpus fasciculatus]